MDRLTKHDYKGELRSDRLVAVLEVFDRLCAYEDTVLTPTEIEQLKAENAQLRKTVAQFERDKWLSKNERRLDCERT